MEPRGKRGSIKATKRHAYEEGCAWEWPGRALQEGHKEGRASSGTCTTDGQSSAFLLVPPAAPPPAPAPSALPLLETQSQHGRSLQVT